LFKDFFLSTAEKKEKKRKETEERYQKNVERNRQLDIEESMGKQVTQLHTRLRCSQY